MNNNYDTINTNDYENNNNNNQKHTKSHLSRQNATRTISLS